ncbi:MAG: GAF domain-containing protein, partial [Anaerolineales bacterium]
MLVQDVRGAGLSVQRSGELLNRVLQWVVFAYQALAVVVFLLGLFFANRWLQTPFLGSFYEHTMIFNDTEASTADLAWAFSKEVKSGDQLIAINDAPVKSAADVAEVLSTRFAGETVKVSVLTLEGETRHFDVTLYAFPESGRTVYFYFPSILSAIFLIISFWIFGFRRTEAAGRAFSLFTSSLAIVTGAFFNISTTHEFTYIWTFSLALTGGGLVALGLVFPVESRAIFNRPYLRWVGILIGILLAAAAFPSLYNFNQPTAYFNNWRMIYGFNALCILFYISINIYHALNAQSPVIKTQARTILFGALIAFVPVGIWLAAGVLGSINFSPYLFLPLIIFPLAIGYTILRFRFLRTDELVRRAVMYLLLSALITLGYSLLVVGVGLLFGSNLPANNPAFVGLGLFIIAVILEPIRTRLQNLVDTIFFRGSRVFTEQLEDFSRKLTTTLDLQTIGINMRDQIASTLTPSRIHIYTYDALNDFFAALPGEDRRPTSDIRFTASSPLVSYFTKERLPLYLDNTTSLPQELQSEQSRLALLGARLFIVLPGKEKLNGWLALGPRLTGQPYTPRDLRFLENICDQASVAIERVQTVSTLERRIQEMNALTRVSKGVNVTLTFDDVLELIYAQTAQIIPTSHFHITLHNKDSDYYYYGFCLENNERISEKENQPFSVNTGLSPDVIRKSRPIITQDYMRECQARGHTPALENVFAWMGVPLNAGAATIGTLSVGSRDGSIAYTRGQLELLQAIADQTAGAIVKARLLEETEQRARQLSTLNEITKQLTSTLELNPLLQNILENAVGILNCEAGSLFLVDEQTDELVFRVTVGPVATNLIGKR